MSDWQLDLVVLTWGANKECDVHNVFFLLDHAIAADGNAAADGKTQNAVWAAHPIRAMNQNIAINIQALDTATGKATVNDLVNDYYDAANDYYDPDEGLHTVAHTIETDSRMVYDTILDADNDIVDGGVQDVLITIFSTAISDDLGSRISAALTQCIFNEE